MSLLGGGDYDGDTVIVIWEPEIVNAFHNAPLRPNGLSQGDPAPDFISEFFDKSVRRVDEVLQSTHNERDLTQTLRGTLLAPIINKSVVGLYSIL